MLRDNGRCVNAAIVVVLLRSSRKGALFCCNAAFIVIEQRVWINMAAGESKSQSTIWYNLVL